MSLFASGDMTALRADKRARRAERAARVPKGKHLWVAPHLSWGEVLANTKGEARAVFKGRHGRIPAGTKIVRVRE